MDAPGSPDILLFDRFRFDRRGRALFRSGDNAQRELVNIGGRALDVLGVLIGRGGEIVSKEEMMTAVWPGMFVEESNLAVQISALRRILDQGREGESCIQTVSGRGYRFALPATREMQVPSAATFPPPVGAVSGAAATQRLPRLRRWTVVLSGGIAVAVVIVAVALEVGWWGQKRSLPRPSLVVLPFADLGNASEPDNLADVITQDLTTDLSRITALTVIGYSSAASYRNRSSDVRQLGRELGVGYIVEGSVRRTGEQVAVNAGLIDADTGAQLPQGTVRFDSEPHSRAQAQVEVTGRLAHTLNIQIVETVARRVEEKEQADPEAWELEIEGWALWNRPFTRDNRAKALASFRQALAKDPARSTPGPASRLSS